MSKRAYVRVDGDGLTIQERRREWKRRYRRKLGVPPKLHDAHVRAHEKFTKAEQVRQQRDARRHLCEAHIELYRRVVRDNSPQTAARRNKRRARNSAEVAAPYVNRYLQAQGFALRTTDLGPALFGALQIFIKLKRRITTMKGKSHDQRK